MNVTPDLQKKIAAVAGFVVLAGAILYLELPGSGTSAVAPAVVTTPAKTAPAAGASKSTGSAGAKTGMIPVPPGNAVGSAAKNLGTTSAQLDPTLRMEMWCSGGTR